MWFKRLLNVYGWMLVLTRESHEDELIKIRDSDINTYSDSEELLDNIDIAIEIYSRDGYSAIVLKQRILDNQTLREELEKLLHIFNEYHEEFLSEVQILMQRISENKI